MPIPICGKLLEITLQTKSYPLSLPPLPSDREENTIKEERLIYLSVQSTAKVMTPLGRRARDVMRLICAARFPLGLYVVHFIRLVVAEGGGDKPEGNDCGKEIRRRSKNRQPSGRPPEQQDFPIAFIR